MKRAFCFCFSEQNQRDLWHATATLRSIVFLMWTSAERCFMTRDWNITQHFCFYLDRRGTKRMKLQSALHKTCGFLQRKTNELHDEFTLSHEHALRKQTQELRALRKGAAQILVWTPTFKNKFDRFKHYENTLLYAVRGLRSDNNFIEAAEMWSVQTYQHKSTLHKSDAFLQHKTNELHETRLQHCAAIGFLLWRARNEANKIAECT